MVFSISKNTIADVDPALRTQLTSESTQISALVEDLYTLTIFDLSDGGSVYSTDNIPLAPTGASSVHDATTAEFVFRVAPKVHEFSEPFATTIQPTQDGGKFVESQGSILKEIRLSGTTGLRPHRNDPRVVDLFGLQIGASAAVLGAGSLSNALGTTPDNVSSSNPFSFSLSDLTQARTVDLTEVTGHDDIVFLRNMFRLYSDLKSSSILSSSIIMLWKNKKDGDYWVVEPMEFRLAQSSSSPLTYEYSILLKTLAPFDFQFTLLKPDPLATLRDARRVYSRVQEYTQNLVNTFLLISQKIEKFSNLPFDIVSVVLAPLSAVIKGLAGVKSSSVRSIATIQANTQLLVSNLTSVLADIDSLRNTDDFREVFGIQDSEERILRRALVTGTKIITDSNLKPSAGAAARDRVFRAVESYQKPVGATSAKASPATGGSSSFLGNQPSISSLGQSKVFTGEDLRDIAGRLLGERSSWHILAVINELKAPYITKSGGPGLLKPGDSILYPTQAGAEDNTISSSNLSESETEIKDAKTQGPIQQAYGRDIRLISAQGSNSLVETDIRPNNLGDVSTVQGIPNVGQALRLKFAIERGELPAHFTFGSKFPIGTKATAKSLSGFRLNASSTILSDPRVLGISTLDVTAFSDVLALTMSLVLKDSNQALKLSLPVRRF